MALSIGGKSVELTWVQQLILSVLRKGPIPRHVAFIMDGNRRFAVKKNVERIKGHSKGFDKLAEVLKWCQDLGVKEVTVYAFSAENFKRSKQEVCDLMHLAREKFTQILEQKDKLDENGVRVRFVGELQRLPKDLQEVASKLESGTKHNAMSYLNICVAYTSRLEMAAGIRSLMWGVKEGILHSEDIDEQLFDSIVQVSEVDLLVRTSGEIRLSDFLLWQTSYSSLSFIKSLWPELSIWQFYIAVLDYQRAFVCKSQLEQNRSSSLWTIKYSQPFASNPTENVARTAQTIDLREKRIRNFIKSLHCNVDVIGT